MQGRRGDGVGGYDGLRFFLGGHGVELDWRLGLAGGGSGGGGIFGEL